MKCLCDMPEGKMFHPKCPIHAPIIGPDINIESLKTKLAIAIEALEEIYIYRPKQAFSKFDNLGGLVHRLMDITNKALAKIKGEDEE